jgi:hypothetical protein
VGGRGGGGPPPPPQYDTELTFPQVLREARETYDGAARFVVQACLGGMKWGQEGGLNDAAYEECSRCAGRWMLLPHEAAAAIRMGVNLTYGARSRALL